MESMTRKRVETLSLTHYEFMLVMRTIHLTIRKDQEFNFLTKTQLLTLTDLMNYMIEVCDLWERKKMKKNRKEEFVCRPGLHDNECGPVKGKHPECRCGCTPSDWCYAQSYLMDQFMEAEMAKTGLSKEHKVTDTLAAVIGMKKASRGSCIKLIWKYIKKRKLNDGRKINTDDRLRALFGGKKSIDMMKIAGFISKNIVVEK